MLVKIEQRLQDTPRFIFFPLDDTLVFGTPALMGLLGRNIIMGLILAFIFLSLWRRIKGEGGTALLVAAMYWFMPSEIGLYRGLPDASVQRWEA